MNLYKPVIWVIIGLWLVISIATLNYNGPFFDEAIYITAGERTLEGYGYSDGYLVWFAGSLIWPILAAVGYEIAGLVGTRIVAVLLSVIALIAVMRAADNLFGPKAAFWAGLALAFNGPFLALSRLGVIDVLALSGIAVSFGAITELIKRDHRVWLLVAALAFTIGLFAKYPMGLMIFPLAGVILVLRRNKAILDIGLLGFVSAGLTLAFYLPGREQLSQVIPWTLAQTPTFGYTTNMLLFELFYLNVAALILAVLGWFFCKDQRLLATVLLASLLIWPVYHIFAWNPVGQQKHVVFGFLFAYPLVGVALSRLWTGYRLTGRAAATVITIVLVTFGTVQAWQFGRWWPDIREPAKYLVKRVQPGDKLLINDSWSYILYLYNERKISSPWDVFDSYRITHGQSELDLCEYDWVISAQGSYDWPPSIYNQIQSCETYEPVFTSDLQVYGLGPDLDLLEFLVNVTIMENDGRELLSEKLDS